jgi:hypothetical protein
MNENLTKVMTMINAMSVEELKNRLAAYMLADESLMPKPIAVEVRLTDDNTKSCRYDVFLLMDDGTEKEVKFRDRYSRLIYIYTLMHPKGYRSAFLKNDNLKGLCDLYSTLYFASAEPLMQYAGDKFKQFFYQSVAQSRVFIRNTDPHAKDFEIACPRKYNGRTLVPAAADADKVIIDNSLK